MATAVLPTASTTRPVEDAHSLEQWKLVLLLAGAGQVIAVIVFLLLWGMVKGWRRTTYKSKGQVTSKCPRTRSLAIVNQMDKSAMGRGPNTAQNAKIPGEDTDSSEEDCAWQRPRYVSNARKANRMPRRKCKAGGCSCTPSQSNTSEMLKCPCVGDTNRCVNCSTSQGSLLVLEGGQYLSGYESVELHPKSITPSPDHGVRGRGDGAASIGYQAFDCQPGVQRSGQAMQAVGAPLYMAGNYIDAAIQPHRHAEFKAYFPPISTADKKDPLISYLSCGSNDGGRPQSDFGGAPTMPQGDVAFGMLDGDSEEEELHTAKLNILQSQGNHSKAKVHILSISESGYFLFEGKGELPPSNYPSRLYGGNHLDPKNPFSRELQENGGHIDISW